jgi:hypothetical protein
MIRVFIFIQEHFMNKVPLKYRLREREIKVYLLSKQRIIDYLKKQIQSLQNFFFILVLFLMVLDVEEKIVLVFIHVLLLILIGYVK